MAIAVGSASFRNVHMRLKGNAGVKDAVTKSFNLDPAITDASIANLVNDFASLSNSGFLSCTTTTQAPITGTPSSPADAIYPNTAQAAVLTFQRTSPSNSAVTLTKEFLIPAPVAAVIDADGHSIIAPDSAGSGAPLALYNLIALLQTGLVAYIKANNTFVIGGWTYQPSESGLVSLDNNFAIG